MLRTYDKNSRYMPRCIKCSKWQQFQHIADLQGEACLSFLVEQVNTLCFDVKGHSLFLPVDPDEFHLVRVHFWHGSEGMCIRSKLLLLAAGRSLLVVDFSWQLNRQLVRSTTSLQALTRPRPNCSRTHAPHPLHHNMSAKSREKFQDSNALIQLSRQLQAKHAADIASAVELAAALQRRGSHEGQ